MAEWQTPLTARLPLTTLVHVRKRKWTEGELRSAVSTSLSIRQVLSKLGLKEAGGNYKQIKHFISLFQINTTHFKGRAWNKGMVGAFRSTTPLENILVRGSTFQSYKLRNKLFKAGIKKPLCEICGWSKQSPDGRIPLELDHINGDHEDNRLENLRILCPNCHSLQPTHRGLNSTKKAGW